ncbi:MULTISPECIES: hypothetical protein [unclassified Microbacterium]|uniref:hypothetical protein n=1 Tax=unclassified Microbacterium TaxID=2609290 RepID=UPI000CFB7D5A|nr:MULTISPECIES: hypothetical protein [unclassified Microbacterium]PQZ52350.1 hypothetical protein CQ032_17460 [Microbacterium sp. MYb43]PQZ74054.1 hypothetical protein CQ031_16465 [Microbacterium sp. MYb40]PRB16709.1 hypothetical protein CQ040_18245 [Microbacterium sp. MYb54]PRB25332.1 hypothetical protein CQ037_14905 [Microbacterium sp. MYb50]PRB60912.1 hypothetical protein CQ021_18165 [Microbacterium sp. MYb24]
MQRRSALVLGLTALLLLTGCTSAAVAGGGSTAPNSEATASPTAESQELDAAAQQAQAWLDAAVVPPGAVRVADSPASFNSYQGWPCTPVAELKGYWTLADSTVAEAANWLQENPPADLVITTGTEPQSEDANLDGVLVGYIPADESQQGIVYTVAKMDPGIAIRAEVAALSASATCASLAPGETWGKPGQG